MDSYIFWEGIIVLAATMAICTVVVSCFINNIK